MMRDNIDCCLFEVDVINIDLVFNFEYKKADA